MDENFPYKDIIDLPHHQASDRKHMSLYDRAAQFAAFQALSGYEDMIFETSRLTDDFIELPENIKEELDRKFVFLSSLIDEGFRPEITVTYFIPDTTKTGGSYASFSGEVKTIDTAFHKLIFYDEDKDLLGKVIETGMIIGIESEWFGENI